MKTPISQKTKKTNEKAFNDYFNANLPKLHPSIIHINSKNLNSESIKMINKMVDKAIKNPNEKMKNKQGGKREGAGRKKVIDYKIEIIHKRVKKGYKEPLLKLINKAIIKYDSKGIG